MYTFNGIGTTLYGKREINSADGTYIATKWFVLAYFPVIPLGSYRVVRGDTSAGFFSTNTLYRSMQKVPLNWKQVGNIYLATWGGLLLFATIFSTLMTIL